LAKKKLRNKRVSLSSVQKAVGHPATWGVPQVLAKICEVAKIQGDMQRE
jgi:hypothetical protein